MTPGVPHIGYRDHAIFYMQVTLYRIHHLLHKYKLGNVDRKYAFIFMLKKTRVLNDLLS